MILRIGIGGLQNGLRIRALILRQSIIIYLRNLPAEVQRFGVSHGFGMIMFNHGRKLGNIFSGQEWVLLLFTGKVLCVV
jgi:hypothetical protein